MASAAEAIFAPAAVRVLRRAITSTSNLLRSKVTSASRPLNGDVQPIAVRSSSGPNSTGRQPIHPAALLRQSRRSATRWSSTYTSVEAAIRRYFSGGVAPGPRFDRSKFPASNTSRAVARLTGRAPFASTLRPNLTGGALPRTAGGYAVPGSGRAGGARYFSHTPAAPAQVVQNVSQAMRAFWLSGQRARLDGADSHGRPRYRAAGVLEDQTARRLAAALPRRTPGSFVDFRINPTVTALSPLAAAFPFATATSKSGDYPNHYAGAATLGEEGFLDVLSVDFARALKDLSAVLADLKRLARLGDLPVLLEKGSVLRVRFPGVDADTLDRLCDDVGVQRGIVGQDLDFDASVGVPIALRFPFAPEGGEGGGAGRTIITSPGGSLRSHDSELSSVEDDAFVDQFMEENPWLSSASEGEGKGGANEGYESMSPPMPLSSGEHGSEDFEGLEGIYRFLEACDRHKGHF